MDGLAVIDLKLGLREVGLNVEGLQEGEAEGLHAAEVMASRVVGEGLGL